MTSSFWTYACAFLLLVVGVYSWDNVCYDNIFKKCENQPDYVPDKCNARYSGFMSHLGEVQSLINLHLQQSYQYMLMASHFGTSNMNRLGFQKFFQGLSDAFWEDTFTLLKYVNLRGGHQLPQTSTDENNSTVVLPGLHLQMPLNVSYDLEEVKSLAFALDLYKHLATRVHTVHKKTMGKDSDADLGTFLEVHFTQRHAERIRELAGLVADLEKMSQTKDYKVAVYLFDQFLLQE